MPKPAVAVLPLDIEARTAAAHMMAQAFSEDPVYHYLLPHEAHYERRLNWMMNFMLRVCARRGVIHQVGQPLRGIAAWLAPGQQVSILDELRAGVMTAPFALGVLSAWRSNSVMGATAQNRLRLAQSKPYWYLWQFAVSAQSRGKGYGRALLQPVLSQADAAGTDCWLDNSNAANLPIYESLGFGTVEEYKIQDGLQTITLWHMRRIPKNNKRIK